MGLFGQADLAGLDVYRQIFRYLAADLSTIDGPPAALDAAVESGRTGAAVGQGFYSWTEDERDEALRRRNAELIRLLRADRGG